MGCKRSAINDKKEVNADKMSRLSRIWHYWRCGRGIKKEGRHPDDQSFNFKNLIPWKTQCKGTAYLQIEKRGAKENARNNTFSPFGANIIKVDSCFVVSTWQNVGFLPNMRTKHLLLRFRHEHVFRSMDDYILAVGVGEYPLPRLCIWEEVIFFLGKLYFSL